MFNLILFNLAPVNPPSNPQQFKQSIVIVQSHEEDPGGCDYRGCGREDR